MLSGEGNENGEKTTIGLIIKKALTLHVQHTVFCYRVLCRCHEDVFRDEKRVIAPHTLSKKNYNFCFMQCCPCSCA